MAGRRVSSEGGKEGGGLPGGLSWGIFGLCWPQWGSLVLGEAPLSRLSAPGVPQPTSPAPGPSVPGSPGAGPLKAEPPGLQGSPARLQRPGTQPLGTADGGEGPSPRAPCRGSRGCGGELAVVPAGEPASRSAVLGEHPLCAAGRAAPCPASGAGQVWAPSRELAGHLSLSASLRRTPALQDDGGTEGGPRCAASAPTWLPTLVGVRLSPNLGPE